MTEHDDALLRGLVDFAAALTAALIATWPQERGREREREHTRGKETESVRNSLNSHVLGSRACGGARV
jgi:hypothetical protein